MYVQYNAAVVVAVTLAYKKFTNINLRVVSAVPVMVAKVASTLLQIKRVMGKETLNQKKEKKNGRV